MADDAELRRRLRAADRVINQMTADAERTQAQLNMAWDLCGKQADEIERLRAAGDALYELVSVRLIIPADQHDDAVEQIRKWREARRG